MAVDSITSKVNYFGSKGRLEAKASAYNPELYNRPHILDALVEEKGSDLIGLTPQKQKG